MGTYRRVWTTIAVAVVVLSSGMAWHGTDRFLAVGVVGGVSAVAAVFGAAWAEDPTRGLRLAGIWGVRGAAIALILAGLPLLLGPWAFLVLTALAALAPESVLALRRRAHRRRDPALGEALWGLSDRELARRWRYTTLAVRSSWRSATERVVLVQERQRILDELERRAPDDWLVRSGWREDQDL